MALTSEPVLDAVGGRRALRAARGPEPRASRPRIVELLATGGTGGAQESYIGLFLRLDRREYDVRAVSLGDGCAISRLRRLGIAVEVIDHPDDAVAVRELAAYLRRTDADLLHAHMYRAEVVGTRAALAAGTPVVMATVHSSRVRSAEDVATLATLSGHVDRLIAPSRSIAAKVLTERPQAAVSIVPNGVDLARFGAVTRTGHVRRELGIPADAPVIGMVARMEPEKGHAYLIGAMPAVLERVPAAWLLIAGEGSLEEQLRAQVDALPEPARSHVAFLGRRDDIAAVTAEFDVAVLPSLREAQGLSILEAMALGVPVVASAVGGIPEVITDGLDGLLVPPESSPDLADAITRLLADPALRHRLGQAGREMAGERFAIETQVRSTQAIYDEELARAGVAGVAPIGQAVRSRSARLRIAISNR